MAAQQNFHSHPLSHQQQQLQQHPLHHPPQHPQSLPHHQQQQQHQHQHQQQQQQQHLSQLSSPNPPDGFHLDSSLPQSTQNTQSMLSSEQSHSQQQQQQQQQQHQQPSTPPGQSTTTTATATTPDQTDTTDTTPLPMIAQSTASGLNPNLMRPATVDRVVSFLQTTFSNTHKSSYGKSIDLVKLLLFLEEKDCYSAEIAEGFARCVPEHFISPLLIRATKKGFILSQYCYCYLLLLTERNPKTPEGERTLPLNTTITQDELEFLEAELNNLHSRTDVVYMSQRASTKEKRGTILRSAFLTSFCLGSFIILGNYLLKRNSTPNNDGSNTSHQPLRPVPPPIQPQLRVIDHTQDFQDMLQNFDVLNASIRELKNGLNLDKSELRIEFQKKHSEIENMIVDNSDSMKTIITNFDNNMNNSLNRIVTQIDQTNDTLQFFNTTVNHSIGDLESGVYSNFLKINNQMNDLVIQLNNVVKLQDSNLDNIDTDNNDDNDDDLVKDLETKQDEHHQKVNTLTPEFASTLSNAISLFDQLKIENKSPSSPSSPSPSSPSSPSSLSHSNNPSLKDSTTPAVTTTTTPITTPLSATFEEKPSLLSATPLISEILAATSTPEIVSNTSSAPDIINVNETTVAPAPIPNSSQIPQKDATNESALGDTKTATTTTTTTTKTEVTEVTETKMDQSCCMLCLDKSTFENQLADIFAKIKDTIPVPTDPASPKIGPDGEPVSIPTHMSDNVKVLKSIRIYLNNISKTPTQEQKRRISASNPTIRSIQKSPLYSSLLTTIGFDINWQWCSLELTCHCTYAEDVPEGSHSLCGCVCAKKKHDKVEIWAAPTTPQNQTQCVCGTLYRVQYALEQINQILIGL